MRQIRAEMTRRAERQVLAPTLREEVKALLIWAQAHIDETIQLPKQQATENALRNDYKRLRSAAVVDEH